MIATRAMQQALCRGIVKPTPVRGRYRYTEFGVNLLPGVSEYLSYTRKEVLGCVADTLDGKDFVLKEVYQKLPLQLVLKTVTAARKVGYVLPQSTPTKTTREGIAGVRKKYVQQRMVFPRQVFCGWRFKVQADMLTPKDFKTLKNIVVDTQILHEFAPSQLVFAFYSFSGIFSELLDKLQGIHLSRYAKLTIEMTPFFE